MEFREVCRDAVPVNGVKDTDRRARKASTDKAAITLLTYHRQHELCPYLKSFALHDIEAVEATWSSIASRRRAVTKLFQT